MLVDITRLDAFLNVNDASVMAVLMTFSSILPNLFSDADDSFPVFRTMLHNNEYAWVKVARTGSAAPCSTDCSRLRYQ